VYFCVQVSVQPLFFCQSWVLFLLGYEFVDLSMKPGFNSFFIGFQWYDITHLVMQISVLAMEPFVGLMSLDLSSALVSQSNPYTTGLFQHQYIEHGPKSHPKQYTGMQEPSFCTLRWLWCWSILPHLAFMQIDKPLGLIDVLPLSSFSTSVKVLDWPSYSPNLRSRHLHWSGFKQERNKL